MKYLLAFLMVGKVAISIGQTVEYRCLIKTDCTGNVSPFNDYMLTQNGHEYRPTDNIPYLLPDTGTYYLTPLAETHISFSVLALPVKVTTSGLTSDTLLSSDLYKILIMHSGDRNANKHENWQFCGQPANGYLVDNTMSGRTEGKFRKGKAIGKVKSDNKQGQLVSIAYYNSKGKHRKMKEH